MSIEDDRIDAGRAVVLSWLGRQVRDHSNAVREHLAPKVDPGERITAKLPDGTVIGTVTIGKPAQSPMVVDERALLDWVRENRPDEVVESVRASYVDHLKEQVRKHGHAFDAETGEIIPGIELREGSPSYRPSVDKDAVPVLQARLGEIVGNGLLALPEGGQA